MEGIKDISKTAPKGRNIDIWELFYIYKFKKGRTIREQHTFGTHTRQEISINRGQLHDT
jgi:hypothetical protein